MTLLRYELRIVAIALLCAASAGIAAPNPSTLPITEVEIRSGMSLHVFRAEVATRDNDLQRGLQGRITLPADGGMLLLADEPRTLDMWMKDTLIPLDILFFDTGGTILAIRARATPHSETRIPSPGPVAGVLELTGGTTERLGIRTGDHISFRLPNVDLRYRVTSHPATPEIIQDLQ